MMPLTMAPIGEEFTVVKINGKDDVRQHLNELGFVPDATVMVVSEIGGNAIVSVKSSRIALDKAMVSRVMVDSPENVAQHHMSHGQHHEPHDGHHESHDKHHVSHGQQHVSRGE